jgi:hypothetical protein
VRVKRHRLFDFVWAPIALSGIRQRISNGKPDQLELCDHSAHGAPDVWATVAGCRRGCGHRSIPWSTKSINSRFPISLWWGPELVMLYNDAWRPIFGKTKHPTWGDRLKLDIRS